MGRRRAGGDPRWGELRSRAYCPECERETTRDVSTAGGQVRLVCTECGTTQG